MVRCLKSNRNPSEIIQNWEPFHVLGLSACRENMCCEKMDCRFTEAMQQAIRHNRFSRSDDVNGTIVSNRTEIHQRLFETGSAYTS
ncbi:hypothetical protein AVEN_28507-1 [Araneus ventricosus]|uniref:Uncharacterized protein n=1 Tax=Araneus ventricosus TaxID=182803 RepID=A0A4Y2R8X1_ARAVE|nr:hypothetical protein AVEN_19929-1 [Araneus ventricosus]GBN71275.1 hypothetical protein AVEN_28507-1 [Araneus ventricosus]